LVASSESTFLDNRRHSAHSTGSVNHLSIDSRAEFERIHETEAFDGRRAVIDSAKVRWSGDE
jgi:hypothetical protein